MVEGKQLKCEEGGGTIEMRGRRMRGETIKMRRRRRENNSNVVEEIKTLRREKCGGGCKQFHYSPSCVEKKVESRFDVKPMLGRCGVDVGSM